MSMPKLPGDTATSAADEVRADGVAQGQDPRPVTDDVPVDADGAGNTAVSAADLRQDGGGVANALKDAGPK